MRICYTGGGTLGHVLPALAVHQELKESPGYQCLYIGSTKRIEREAVEGEDVPFKAIASGKLRRYFSLHVIIDVFAIVIGFFQSLVILFHFKPDVLFSKGGYVSVPPVYAAHFLHIPIVSHESDADPGLATRLTSRYSNKICIAYEQARGVLPFAKTVVTGNPIRSQLRGPLRFDMKQRLGTKLPLILVTGGSQGALQINRLVWDNLDELCNRAFVYHQYGIRRNQETQHENYYATSYIGDELRELYNDADLVICRSGAGTIAELCFFGKPSLLVPLSLNASRGDQILNAKRLEEREAALVLHSEKDFVPMVFSLLDDWEKRSILSKNIRSLDCGDAAKNIASVIISCIPRKGE